MNTKIVFFDIDGTLVSFSTHKIPESTKQAVHELRQKGVKVYIATGRPMAFIDNLDGLEYDGMVTTTGAYCVDGKGKTIHYKPIPHEDIERVVRHHLLHPEEAYPIFFVCSDGVYMSKSSDEVREVVQLLNLEMPEMMPIEQVLGRDVLQVISFFKKEDEAYIMSEYMPGSTSTRWHPYFTDIIAKGESKSTGIDCVLRHEGINLNESMAFGDGGNDVDMLRHVAYGVAMGNACDEVKTVADYVTDTVDNDGILKALQHLDLVCS